MPPDRYSHSWKPSFYSYVAASNGPGSGSHSKRLVCFDDDTRPHWHGRAVNVDRECGATHRYNCHAMEEQLGARVGDLQACCISWITHQNVGNCPGLAI